MMVVRTATRLLQQCQGFAQVSPCRMRQREARMIVGAWGESIMLIIGLSVAMNDVHGYTLI
jgi:hypothetical protein